MQKWNLKRFLLGTPLPNQSADHERLPKWKALPVFASDALSSVAYATEEILIILTSLAAAAAVWSIPIALTICALLVVVSISYRQTISLYPSGGGAYTVAKENLGETAGLLAGAALLLDYILTVAVSVSAGVAAIVSAFPFTAQHGVFIGGVLILIMMFANLRGMRESGFFFSIPTYFFLAILTIMVVRGGWQLIHGTMPAQAGLMHEVYPQIGLFLLLRAFSSGCAALTGIEAISNGVPAFKKPCDKNAKTTMTLMVTLLGVFFFGITALAHMHLILPNAHETVLSQIARLTFGTGPLYYMMQIATAMILILAANTAFADFPRIASVLAQDRFLPRQLSNIGDRLVFSNGIVSLGFAAFLLVLLFGAETHALIPLYSVGVFLSFTLSQAGMVAHHLTHKEPHWFKGLIVNSVGAVATFLVLLVVAGTKFLDGAWITVLIVPLMLILFRSIKSHYIDVGNQLTLASGWRLEAPVPSLVVIPISGIHSGVLNALQYARGISRDIRVLTIDINPQGTEALKRTWQEHIGTEEGLQLVSLESPYRSVIVPILDYLEMIEDEYPDRTITVIIPEFVTGRWWQNFLHNQTAFFLKTRLLFIERRVVISVSHHLKA